MNIRKIMKFILHPATIKIVGVICIVGFFFILPTYAQNATTDGSLGGVQKFLKTILSICSRGWIILAVLAGKLMTNDRVYGSILHMDIYLWKIWNMMKNFANFTLVAVIIGSIISNLVGKKGMDFKSLITKTLVAGILIQASRFLVGALVDLSTIAVSAVGAFPTSFLQTDTTLQNKIKTSLGETYDRYLVDGLSGTMKPIGEAKVATQDEWEQILPTYNSVSGPLIYLGMSVFKFQNYLNTDPNPDAETLTISFLLRFVLIFFYTVGLALLFIANIIRVVFLRIFIIASPFIVLFSLFKEQLGMKEGGKGIGGYLNFKTMIDMIFKPVIFVAGFSLILILVVSIQSIMNGTIPKSFNGVEIGVNSGGSTLAIEGISNIEIKENGIFGKDPLSKTTETVKDISQTIFVNLLIFFMTIFLMRQFVKMAITSGEGPIKDIMEPMVGWIEKAAKAAPVIPLAGGMSLNAAQKFSQGQKQNLAKGFGMNTEGKFTDAETKFDEYISGKFGMLADWKSQDYTELGQIITNGGDFMSASIQKAGKKHGGLTLGNESRRAKLEEYLKTDKGKEAFKNQTLPGGIKGNRKGNWADTFEKDTEDAKNNRLILHNRMGGNDKDIKATDRSAKNKPTYSDLTSNAYYRNTAEEKSAPAPEEPIKPE